MFCVINNEQFLSQHYEANVTGRNNTKEKRELMSFTAQRENKIEPREHCKT